MGSRGIKLRSQNVRSLSEQKNSKCPGFNALNILYQYLSLTASYYASDKSGLALSNLRSTFGICSSPAYCRTRLGISSVILIEWYLLRRSLLEAYPKVRRVRDGWSVASAGMSGAWVRGVCRLSTGTQSYSNIHCLCASLPIHAEATYHPSRIVLAK